MREKLLQLFALLGIDGADQKIVEAGLDKEQIALISGVTSKGMTTSEDAAKKALPGQGLQDIVKPPSSTAPFAAQYADSDFKMVSEKLTSAIIGLQGRFDEVNMNWATLTAALDKSSATMVEVAQNYVGFLKTAEGLKADVATAKNDAARAEDAFVSLKTAIREVIAPKTGAVTPAMEKIVEKADSAVDELVTTGARAYWAK